MKTICKYPLYQGTRTTLDMHKGACVLHVGEQNDVLCLWAMVDTDQPIEQRTFRAVAMGEDMGTERLGYFGTGTAYGCTLVWHVFEVLP